MLFVALAQLVIVAGLAAALFVRERDHAAELGRAHGRTSGELLELANRVQHPQFFQPPQHAPDPGDVVEPELDGFELAGRHAELEDEFDRLLDVDEG